MQTSKLFYYTVIDGLEDNFDPEEGFKIQSESRLYSLSNDIGNDYFHCRDGWEASWPIKFRVWNEDGSHHVDLEIILETEPTFYGRKIND